MRTWLTCWNTTRVAKTVVPLEAHLAGRLVGMRVDYWAAQSEFQLVGYWVDHWVAWLGFLTAVTMAV